MSISDLPSLNAALNAVSTMLLLVGYGFIRRRETQRHRLCMVAAFIVSVAFLASYVVYHYHIGSTHFTGVGWIRPLYFTMLASHVVLAALIPPLALITLFRAARGEFEQHRRIARWTLPAWLYVSCTGVMIYWMLYHAYGA